MGQGKQITVLLIAAALIAALVAGCGSSGSSSSSSSSESTSSSAANTTTGSSADSTAPASSSEGGSSAEFIKKGEKNKIVEFGKEASASEREAASSVLEENLQAREAGDWAGQCSSLTAAAVKNVAKEAALTGTKGSCATDLKKQAEPESQTKAIRANTMTGPIAVLLVEGNKAYALYHGTKGKDYAMPMGKEGDEWKVDALITKEIP
jgi:hypothetical protein